MPFGDNRILLDKCVGVPVNELVKVVPLSLMCSNSMLPVPLVIRLRLLSDSVILITPLSILKSAGAILNCVLAGEKFTLPVRLRIVFPAISILS